jgi:hypothetical protein
MPPERPGNSVPPRRCCPAGTAATPRKDSRSLAPRYGGRRQAVPGACRARLPARQSPTSTPTDASALLARAAVPRPRGSAGPTGQGRRELCGRHGRETHLRDGMLQSCQVLLHLLADMGRDLWIVAQPALAGFQSDIIHLPLLEDVMEELPGRRMVLLRLQGPAIAPGRLSPVDAPLQPPRLGGKRRAAVQMGIEQAMAVAEHGPDVGAVFFRQRLLSSVEGMQRQGGRTLPGALLGTRQAGGQVAQRRLLQCGSPGQVGDRRRLRASKMPGRKIDRGYCGGILTHGNEDGRQGIVIQRSASGDGPRAAPRRRNGPCAPGAAGDCPTRPRPPPSAARGPRASPRCVCRCCPANSTASWANANGCSRRAK